MSRCLLLSAALSVQLAVCMCNAASSSRQMTFTPSHLAESDDDDLPGPNSATGPFTLHNLQFRPKLLTLLQLGLLSSRLRDEPDGSQSEEEDLQLDKRISRLPSDSLEPGRRRLVVPPTRSPPKKMSGMSQDRHEGPRLSIVNPLDVLRQKMMLEILRQQKDQNRRLVEENAKIMEGLGKRSLRPDYDDRTLIRPNRQRLSQFLSSLTSSV